MTKDEALRLALEALEGISGSSDDPNNGWRGNGTDKLFACEYCGQVSEDCSKIPHLHKCPVPKAYPAITAIKQALAQPEPPCKTGSQCTSKCDGCTEPEPVVYQDIAEKCRLETVPAKGTLLNTSPPKREWQGLTDEEVFDIWLNEMPAPDKMFYQKLCRSVEAKLKQKNGFAEEKNA